MTFNGFDGIRPSSLVGMLLAAYFVPAWCRIAWQIAVQPVFGLYQTPNLSVALFVSDHLEIFGLANLSGMATVKVAWLLALARSLVAAFFALFLVLVAVPRLRRGAGEALALALGLGSALSFPAMLMAHKVGESAALRLHAYELLALLAAVVIMALEKPTPRPAVA